MRGEPGEEAKAGPKNAACSEIKQGPQAFMTLNRSWMFVAGGQAASSSGLGRLAYISAAISS